jgi:hypothetical protein
MISLVIDNWDDAVSDRRRTMRSRVDIAQVGDISIIPAA